MRTPAHIGRGILSVTLPALLVLAACGDSATAPDAEETAVLLSVIPAGGATNVDPNQPVTLEFNHALGAGMKDYVDLHEGDVTGPEVEGLWTVSADGRKLTFQPAQPLKPATTYTIHVGGGMMDEDGHLMNLEEHGSAMGGMWATGSMMTGGAGMGMNGGMVFTFTTAG
ncbi:MAG: Ig-like domain-containing protein [Gemmatimonadota bacterium]